MMLRAKIVAGISRGVESPVGIAATRAPAFACVPKGHNATNIPPDIGKDYGE
jgi:hypothetical protein